MKKGRLIGAAAMLFATLIWGSSFVVMKDTLNDVKPLMLLAARFVIAAAVLSLVCIPRFRKLDAAYLGHGALMGLLLGSAYILQTYGLVWTTPGKNAFLTTFYVVLVPFMYWATDGKKPDGYNIAAAVLCVAGVGFLSLAPGDGTGINLGDLLTLACGVFYGGHIVAVRRATEKKDDVILLTWAQFVTAAVICLAGALIFEGRPAIPAGRPLWSIVYLGLAATALGLFLQNWGQERVPPSPASVILSFEAVFGAAFSLALGYDEPKPRLFIGFALMFLAVIVSEVKPFRKRKPGP